MMVLLTNKRLDKINSSELSDRIKPIYESAYAICQEFGHEEGRYWNWRYIDENMSIQHSNVKNATEVDAFSSGKYVHIEYKRHCVFDCIIKLNGDIRLKVFESGEWMTYFTSLERTLKLTLLARKKLEEYYRLCDIFYRIIHKDSQNRYVGYHEYRDRSFRTGKFRVNYDIRNGYTFADDKIKIKFNRNEKMNVASAAVITFKGKTVFNAVHFFPSNHRPFSSNTRCKVLEKGEWEEYLTNAINSFRVIYGV